MIALVMQSLDNSITTFPKKTRRGWVMTSRQGHGQPNPTWIPAGNEVVRRLARLMGGHGRGTIGEPFNRPMTAHFIGGCTIGDSPETGVVDAYQRVYGYPGLHIADGSAISANLGVNPSLTITAQAERAMSFWPNKGEEDPRPALGTAYRRWRPSRRARRSSRTPPRGPCGCPSSASAETFGPCRESVAGGRNHRPAGSLCDRTGRQLPRRPDRPRSPAEGSGPVRARPPSLPGRALIWRSGPNAGLRRGGPMLVGPPRRRRPARHALDSGRGGTRSGPRRRLRGAVRPAHRPAGPGGPGLLRDRAAHDAGRGDAGAGAQGDHPVRRTVVGLRGGCARRRPGDLRGQGPGLRHVLRLPADGARARRRRRAHRGAGVRPDPGPGRRARRAPRGPARCPHRLDVPRRLGGGGARRLHGAGVDRRDPGGGLRGPRPAARGRPVAPRGAAHRARPARPRALPAPDRRLPPDLDDGQHRRGAGRADPRADRRGGPGHLRSLRWGGLRRRRGGRAARHR